MNTRVVFNEIVVSKYSAWKTERRENERRLQTLFGFVVLASFTPPAPRSTPACLQLILHNARARSPPSLRPRRRRTAPVVVAPVAPAPSTNAMADGSRRKQHRPVFVVANPDSSDEDSHLPRQSSSSPSSSCVLSHNRFVSPLISRPHVSLDPLNTTNLPDRNARHQAYSNPTLSSPSGTSSPPPSTPGQPLPPVDIPVERPDVAHVNNSTDAIPQQHSFFPNTRMHFPNKSKQTRRLNGRPATVRPSFLHSSPARGLTHDQSPSTSTTSDSFTPRFTPDNRSSPIDKVCIFVTGDSDQYYTVDITGFTNAAFIKELMFSKVRTNVLILPIILPNDLSLL